MKDVCMTKCINTSTKRFLNINAVFAKVITLNMSTDNGREMERGLK